MISTGLGVGLAFGSLAGADAGDGVGVAVGDACGSVVGGCLEGFGVSSLKRSRNWSSRNLGVRGSKSTRASWAVSVRWPVSKSKNVPSGLHETVLLPPFARKLTGRLSPPVAETTLTFLNNLSPTGMKAIHLLSGDQTNGRLELSGGRSRCARARLRSFFESMSMTRISSPRSLKRHHLSVRRKLRRVVAGCLRASAVSLYSSQSRKERDASAPSRSET